MRCLHWLHACLTFIQWCLERFVQQGLLLNSWLIQLTLLSCKWVFMEIKRRRGRGRGSHVLALCFEWSSVNFSNVAGDVLFLNIKLGAPFMCETTVTPWSLQQEGCAAADHWCQSSCHFFQPEKQGAGRFNLGAVPPLAAEKGALLLKRSSSDKEKRSKTVMKL